MSKLFNSNMDFFLVIPLLHLLQIVGNLMLSFHPISCTDDSTENSFPNPNRFVPNNSITNKSMTGGGHVRNNTVKAWTTPFKDPPQRMLPHDSYTRYSKEMLTVLVENFHNHSTTNDPLNEVYYTRRRIGDNVWFNVERVANFKMFMDWAISTSKIMDKRDKSGITNIKSYIQKAGERCSPESSFDVSEDVILSDNKNLRSSLDPQLKEWFRRNQNTPPESICNKFRGLKCNPSKRVCECESRDNTVHFMSYTRTEQDKPGQYPDGCYVRPWKKCNHLSLDTIIPSEYKSYHAHPNNMKQFLFRLATPFPRMPRCEKGSYCVDMILNKKQPICWCSSRMHSKECYNTNGGIPLLEQFLEIRKRFHQMMIPERDKATKCTLDEVINQNLEDINELVENVQGNYQLILRLMKEVVGKGGRICDFRKGLACDPYRKTCTYRNGCGPGRVIEEGMGFGRECRINNGYPCPTIELECITTADCKDFGQGRHCHCSNARYGDLCRFGGSAFFSSILHARISGFMGYHFANLQELMNHVLAPVERIMTLGFGDQCNPNLDRHAMSIVRYMGGLRYVSLDQLDEAIESIQYLVGKDEPLCNYRRFLYCTMKSRCEPMIPDVVQYAVKPAPDYPGGARVHLSLRPMARCYGPGNYSNIPPIFHDIIYIKCLPFHECRKVEGRVNSRHKYCLCPAGFQGVRCNEKIAQTKKVEVYEIPEPMLMMPAVLKMATTNDNEREKHIDIVHTI